MLVAVKIQTTEKQPAERQNLTWILEEDLQNWLTAMDRLWGGVQWCKWHLLTKVPAWMTQGSAELCVLQWVTWKPSYLWNINVEKCKLIFWNSSDKKHFWMYPVKMFFSQWISQANAFNSPHENSQNLYLVVILGCMAVCLCSKNKEEE